MKLSTIFKAYEQDQPWPQRLRIRDAMLKRMDERDLKAKAWDAFEKLNMSDNENWSLFDQYVAAADAARLMAKGRK